MSELKFLCITQNIGSLECAEGGFTETVRAQTREFTDSVNRFVIAAGKKMCAAEGSKGNQGESASNGVIDVVVVHLQEIGGKKFCAEFNEFLNDEVRNMNKGAKWCSGVLMQSENCGLSFTAMGTVIFLSHRVAHLSSILSVRQRTFVSIDDDPVTFAGSRQHLFHGKKFSDADTSRKGYLLTSLRVGTQTINFVNLHLFHDSDNSIATSASPSQYVARRVNAFVEGMAEVASLFDPSDPCFIFGDLNTRLDGKQLLEYAKMTLGQTVSTKKKWVEADEGFWSFMESEKNVHQILKFDLELSNMLNVAAADPRVRMELGEFPINFPPTYVKGDDLKFTQIDPATGEFVMKRLTRPFKYERVPGFCDRILFNPLGMALASGKQTISVDDKGHTELTESEVWKQYIYDSVVFDATDHDGVFLCF